MSETINYSGTIQNRPVRIRAAALGDQIPARDLFVARGHAILIEGRLILAECLVNGITITCDPTLARLDYYNIDLGRHDCIIAEGAFAESFADAKGLRDRFANAAEHHALYPDEPPPAELALCAPRPEQGEALNAVLRRSPPAPPPGSSTARWKAMSKKSSMIGTSPAGRSTPPIRTCRCCWRSAPAARCSAPSSPAIRETTSPGPAKASAGVRSRSNRPAGSSPKCWPRSACAAPRTPPNCR